MQQFFSLLSWRIFKAQRVSGVSRPSSGAQWLQWQPLVLPSYRGDSRAVGRGRAGRPDHDQQHCYHHAPTVKPEAVTAVVELLMMDLRTPETCWAVHKRQVIKLRICCVRLVDLFGKCRSSSKAWKSKAVRLWLWYDSLTHSPSFGIFLVST